MTLCAYCRKNAAVNLDHVIPRSLVRKYNLEHLRRCGCEGHRIPAALLVLEPSCFACNMHKGTRRLVPVSWKERLDTLSDLFPGTPWRTWDGDTRSPAFTAVHI